MGFGVPLYTLRRPQDWALCGSSHDREQLHAIPAAREAESSAEMLSLHRACATPIATKYTTLAISGGNPRSH